MSNRLLRARFVLSLTVVTLLAICGYAGGFASRLVMAQELPPPPGEVIIAGLNGPMGVLVGDDGAVYAVDYGLGGDLSFTASVGDSYVGPVGGGPSAQVVKYDPADGSTRVLAMVNSYGAPDHGFSGGSRLAMIGSDLYVSVGDWLITDGNPIDPPMALGTIDRINDDGTTTIVFDGWAHERDHNPYGSVYHGHPFGIVGTEEGTLLVADAGANAVLDVDPATGEATIVAVMNALPGVYPRPEYDSQLLTDPVPTSAILHDGVIYVSLLSGVPIAPGNARVVTVNDDGTVSDYATGLSALTDLREAPDGNLYAVSLAAFGAQGPDPTSGAILRIGAGDTSQVVLDGLTFPTSLDFDADGNTYITVNGLGAPGSGQVIKVAGLMEEEGTPYRDVLAAMMAAAPAEAAAMATEPAPEETAAMAMEEPAAATAMPAEEATAMPAEEATAMPAEEATAMPAPEETVDQAPEMLPVTGADSPTMAFVAIGALALLALAALTFAMRRRG